MPLIELAGEIALLVLIPLLIVILFYLAKIAALSIKEKSSSFLSLNQATLQEKYQVELMKLREQSENEQIKILADAILSLFPAGYRITAEPGTLEIQERKEKVKLPEREEIKGWSKAQLAYEKAMREENPVKRKVLLQKVVVKYFDSEWADRALEEIVKIKGS
jgi:hypothetical protein